MARHAPGVFPCSHVRKHRGMPSLFTSCESMVDLSVRSVRAAAHIVKREGQRRRHLPYPSGKVVAFAVMRAFVVGVGALLVGMRRRNFPCT